MNPANLVSGQANLTNFLDPNIDPRKVCHGIPTDVTKSSTYIVDLVSLKHPDDIKKDFLACSLIVVLTVYLFIPMCIKMDTWK